MRFPSKLIRGTLIQRYKRFLADVQIAGGEVVVAHCTNTGSMLGCKEPGSLVYLSRSANGNRKLAYTWEMIRVGGAWVGINTMHPNRLVAEAIAAGLIPELGGYETVRREVKVGTHSRLDLCLEGREGYCFVEVKNVTISFSGAAAFPDAVSERATRHLKELMRLKRKGHRAAVVFIIQRGDCDHFRPADEIDPEYGGWLRRAVKAGVEVLPYIARVTPREIRLSHRIESRLQVNSAVSRPANAKPAGIRVGATGRSPLPVGSRCRLSSVENMPQPGKRAHAAPGDRRVRSRFPE